MSLQVTTQSTAGRGAVIGSSPALHVVTPAKADDGADRGIARIDASACIRVFEASVTLFEQGEGFTGLYHVVSGLVGVRIIDEAGHLSLLAIAKAGDVIGYCPLLLGGNHVTSALVLNTSRIVHVEPAASRRLVREHPEVGAALLRQSTRDLAALQQKHIRTLTQEAHVRLAGMLLSLVDDCRNDSSMDCCAFVLPLARQDVADFLGIRAETLSRALRHLRELGVAAINGREVEIPSLSRLRQVADADAVSHLCAV